VDQSSRAESRPAAFPVSPVQCGCLRLCSSRRPGPVAPAPLVKIYDGEIMSPNLFFKFILFLLFSLSLNACVANGLLGKTPIIANDNFATVRIARPNGFTGCGPNTRLQINHSDFYGIACGEQISFRVPSNETITISQVSTMSPDHIEVKPEKGEIIYLVYDCIPFVGCGLSEVEKIAFRSFARKCGEEITLGYEGVVVK
jgi:hypothetical protein